MITKFLAFFFHLKKTNKTFITLSSWCFSCRLCRVSLLNFSLVTRFHSIPTKMAKFLVGSSHSRFFLDRPIRWLLLTPTLISHLPLAKYFKYFCFKWGILKLWIIIFEVMLLHVNYLLVLQVIFHACCDCGNASIGWITTMQVKLLIYI